MKKSLIIISFFAAVIITFLFPFASASPHIQGELVRQEITQDIFDDMLEQSQLLFSQSFSKLTSLFEAKPQLLESFTGAFLGGSSGGIVLILLSVLIFLFLFVIKLKGIFGTNFATCAASTGPFSFTCTVWLILAIIMLGIGIWLLTQKDEVEKGTRSADASSLAYEEERQVAKYWRSDPHWKYPSE